MARPSPPQELLPTLEESGETVRVAGDVHGKHGRFFLRCCGNLAAHDSAHSLAYYPINPLAGWVPSNDCDADAVGLDMSYHPCIWSDGVPKLARCSWVFEFPCLGACPRSQECCCLLVWDLYFGTWASADGATS